MIMSDLFLLIMYFLNNILLDVELFRIFSLIILHFRAIRINEFFINT